MGFRLLRGTAAALLSATALGAQAQGNVSLYGLLDMSAGSFQNPGADAVKRVESGKMTTSYIGFKGSDDLGGGLSASFAIESFLRADNGEVGRFNGDAFWARNAYAAVNGGFGSVSLGRNTTSLFITTLVFNAFGDSFGFSPSIRHYFTSGTVTGDTGWSDSIKYTSPRFGGGASVAAHVALGEGSGGRNSGVAGLYFAGPLSLGGAWQKVEKGAALDDTSSWQLAGAYELATVKLFAQYGNVKNETTVNRFKITGLGAAVPVGLGKVLAQWGRISPDTGAKLTTLSLGYDHNLSKQTDVYAVYMNDKREGLAAGNNYGVGIRLRF